ncbi:MAG: glycosyltransferase family 1 protein [Chloroflexota bacterium]
MHIGINYTAALRQGAGIGRYTRGLVQTLAELDQQNAYTLVITRDSPQDGLFPLPPNFQVKVLPLSERWLTILWHRLYLPLYIDRWAGPFDLFHSPDFVLPPLKDAVGLVTVHDLSFMRHPDGAVPKLRQWLDQVVPWSIARATHVLADSHSTQQDLQILLKTPPEKISVVGAGVETRFQPISDQTRRRQVQQKYQLPPHFVLGLGTLEPRKNFLGLIQAFEQIAAECPDLHLVIGGGKGWLYDAIFTAAQTSIVTDRIHLIGYVADEDLPTLYSLAAVFAYPSHYEGFGIPVLEAMSCGTPVVTADNSSLPEVAGEAALLVDSNDITGCAQAIKDLVTQPTLRQQKIAAGLQQADQFRWSVAATKLMSVYKTFSANT